MSDKKSCVRCSRAIDEWASICPFCNWDQSQPVPAEEPPQPAAAAAYTPPDERNLRKTILMIAGAVVLLVASFAVGYVVNRDDAPKKAPEPLAQQAAEHNAQNLPRRADTPLVPVNEPGGFETPITSAPVAVPDGQVPPDYQRTDATAVSSVEYAQIAKRAEAERQQAARMTDPRSITGPAYTPAPARRQPAPQQTAAAEPPARRSRSVVRTRPVPQRQPLPSLNATGTARLTLVVGPDGRVRQIDIERPLSRDTAELVAAVRRWRFKPATENGRPVAAPYSVEISFKP